VVVAAAVVEQQQARPIKVLVPMGGYMVAVVAVAADPFKVLAMVAMAAKE
jgi:hypothetical protein